MIARPGIKKKNPDDPFSPPPSNNGAWFADDFIGFIVYRRDPGGIISRPRYFGRSARHYLKYGTPGYEPDPDSFGWFCFVGEYVYWEYS